MANGITLTSSPQTLSGTYDFIYGPATGTYTVSSLGTVKATGNAFPAAIYLKLGGSVTNGSTSVTNAAVTGYGTNAGVAIVGARGAVTNFGTISGGTNARGVELYDGGTVTNGSPTDTSAAIIGHGALTGTAGFTAVLINGTTSGIPPGGGSGAGGGGGAGGIITGGPITNSGGAAAGIVIPTGSISGPAGSTVINYGTIGDSGARSGVAFTPIAGPATVINGSTADTVALIISGAGSTGAGVYIGGPSGGSIQNYATIGGPNGRVGIYLGTLSGNVTITNGSASDTKALITGANSNGSGISSKASNNRVTITNFGTVSATAGSVIYLFNGGTITNGSSLDTSAVIQAHGPHSEVYTKYGVATVTNYGTIGSSLGHAGISFGSVGASGKVVNGTPTDTSALIFGGTTTGADIYFDSAGGGTVVNFATIGAPAARDGVDLGTFGGPLLVTNGGPTDTTALITGGSTFGHGIVSDSPTGLVNVLNFGTIAATAGAAIALAGGGSIHNGTTLDTSAAILSGGSHAAVYVSGGVTTIANYGTIGSAVGSNAVAFTSPASRGVVVNGSTADQTALIMGGATAGNAINAGGPAVPLYITNFGTIVATAAAAIDLGSGGTVTNGSTRDTNALIQAPGTHSAIYTPNGFTTVFNFGTIGGGASGVGVGFGSTAANGIVTNGSTADTTALIMSGTSAGSAIGMGNPNSVLAVTNFGTITSVSENPIYLAGGGTVTNGSALDTIAAIIGNNVHAAIVARRFVTVTNFGTISNPGPLHPVYATAGALITNGSTSDTTALMSAIGSGIHIQGGALTLNNFGTIANTALGSSAVYTFGGAITNGSASDTKATLIVQGNGGTGIGEYGAQAGSITNFGTISGGTGIVFNSAAAGIGTVVNAGTIASSFGTTGDAILFDRPGALVVADPGAVFYGLVDASDGGNTVLRLASGASTGTLDGIGANFLGFVSDTVDPGANWVLTGSNTLAAGTTLQVDGTLSVIGDLDGVGTVSLNAGTAALGADLASFIGINLVTPTVNKLILSGSPGDSLTNAITGFGLGNTIEVAGVTFNEAVLNGAQLQLTDGGDPVFTLESVGFGDDTNPEFAFGTDGFTGQSFIEVVPCFAAGTRILTTSGELAVEAVRAGMLVPSLAHGRPLRVVWVGHRQVDCAGHPRPHEVWPVRIAAHAFAPDAPHRELLLSPDHAVALPDQRGGMVLIPVRYLVNGATIVQQRRDGFFYFHVELESHGVVLAEGLAAETYLDTGNRCAFANGGGAVLAHPEFARRVWESEACAPLVISGPVLARARAALLARAQGLGFALTGDPDLVVMAGGSCVLPTPTGADWLEAALPPHAVEARLVSRTMVPAEISGSADCRGLGVAVTAMTLDDVPIALDDARLLDGWHAAEPGLRWTGGDARLAVAGHRVLRLRISRHERYWATSRAARMTLAGVPQ